MNVLWPVTPVLGIKVIVLTAISLVFFLLFYVNASYIIQQRVSFDVQIVLGWICPRYNLVLYIHSDSFWLNLPGSLLTKNNISAKQHKIQTTWGKICNFCNWFCEQTHCIQDYLFLIISSVCNQVFVILLIFC